MRAAQIDYLSTGTTTALIKQSFLELKVDQALVSLENLN
jgi:hypothetical protein